MDNNTRELRMARGFYGYGCWQAPYWFIGPEEGKGRDEPKENTKRVDAWFESGCRELCDCSDFHRRIGEQRLHREIPVPALVPTWRSLMVLLMTYLDNPAEKDDLREYQRRFWGAANGGETCVIELSGMAAKSLADQRDRELFRQTRIEMIRKKIAHHKPRFVIMYGAGSKKNWEAIVGRKLVRGQITKQDSTLLVFTVHPNTRGLEDKHWINLGKELRATPLFPQPL